MINMEQAHTYKCQNQGLLLGRVGTVTFIDDNHGESSHTPTSATSRNFSLAGYVQINPLLGGSLERCVGMWGDSPC
jgi:hypothetical protein